MQSRFYRRPLIGRVNSERTIIWGAGTTALAYRLDVDSLDVVDLGDCSPTNAVELCLEMENRPGTFELPEVVDLLDWLEKQEAERTGSIREMVDGEKKGLCAQAERTRLLPAKLRQQVVAGTLSLRHAEHLMTMPVAVIDAVLEASETMSFSVRRALITMIYELTRGELSTEAEILEALRSPDPKERIEALRYPAYMDARSALKSASRRHLAGTGVTVSAPDYFEGEELTLQIPFSSTEQLMGRLDAVRGVATALGELTVHLG